MDLTDNNKLVPHHVRIMRWIARTVGTIMLAFFGLIITGEAFDAGMVTGLTFLAPYIIGLILFFTWDRWNIVRIPGVIGILAPVLTLLFKLVSDVPGVDPDEVMPIFSIVMMLLGIFLALKWEGLGGVIAMLGWIGFAVFFRNDEVAEMLMLNLLLSPFMIIGGLYLFCWWAERKSQANLPSGFLSKP